MVTKQHNLKRHEKQDIIKIINMMKNVMFCNTNSQCKSPYKYFFIGEKSKCKPSDYRLRRGNITMKSLQQQEDI